MNKGFESLVLCSLCLLCGSLLIPTAECGEQFKGKVVSVTGGSSGIGFAASLAFARQGAKVVFCSRDSHPDWYNGTATMQQINEDSEVVASGGSARWFKADVSDWKQAKAFIDSIIRNEGTLDISVNNAAITGPLGTIDTIAEYLKSENDPILNNIYGVLNCLNLQVSYWKKVHKNGIIINTSSRDGLFGTPSGSLYGASKHAIIGITQSVALEYAKETEDSPQIRVVAIAPGLTDTPFTRNQVKWMNDGTQPWEGRLITEDDPLWLEYGPWWEAQLPNGVIAQPTDMSNMMLFLASEKASYVSGATISVDFGSSAV